MPDKRSSAVEIHAKTPLVDVEAIIRNGLILRVNLDDEWIDDRSYRAKKHTA